jgi:hypothetical protein
LKSYGGGEPVRMGVQTSVAPVSAFSDCTAVCQYVADSGAIEYAGADANADGGAIDPSDTHTKTLKI